MRGADKRLVSRALVGQVLLSLVLASGLSVFGAVPAYSGLIGGGVATAANGVFAFWVFRPYRAQEAGKILSRFFGAEIAKMAVIALAFTIVFLWVQPLSVAALFGCFIVIHLVPAVLSAYG